MTRTSASTMARRWMPQRPPVLTTSRKPRRRITLIRAAAGDAQPPASPYDQSKAPTAHSPYPGGGAAKTDMRHVAPTAGGRPYGTVPPPPAPPPAYVMTPYAQKRSPLPWILAGLGALI